MARQASLPVIALALTVAALTQFIKVLPQLMQNRREGDASLRHDLLQRVTELEAEVKSLRQALDSERMFHAAEVLDMQHDLANEGAVLEAFLMLAESSPEKINDHIAKVREMRQRHQDRMATKRGAREASLLAATATPSPSE